MPELDKSVEEEIIKQVKEFLGLTNNPISVEYVEAMDMVTLKFSDKDINKTEDVEIGGHLAVVEKNDDEIVEVAYMGVSNLLNK